MALSDSRLSTHAAQERVGILVVEDEKIIALNLKECLESLGYEVVGLADTAQEAIAQASELRPRLVLMDIRLKGKTDGIQAAEQIWNTLQIPVIYITGHSDQSTLERAKLTAPFGYLLKPIKEKELYIVIESALQRFERERLLLNVFRGMGDGVIVADTQSQVLFVNRIAENLTGWSQAESRNRSLTEVFPIMTLEGQRPMLPELLATVLQQDDPIYLDQPFSLISKDNRVIPIADSIISLKDKAGNASGVVIVFRDVTPRLQAEQQAQILERSRQLEEQMAEMQRLNQLKEDFLATTSHEMRTPLANIKVAIRLLEVMLEQQGLFDPMEAAPDSPIARYLQILNQECDQELNLVNDLLELRALDGNPAPLECTSVQICDWLLHIMENFRERTQHQQQQLQVEIETDLPPIVTELTSLTRIVTELTHNACKYTLPGEQIVITAKAIARTDLPPLLQQQFTGLREHQMLLSIVVSNSGVEIPADELANIFTPFYRILSHDPWKNGGTGLGLALVAKLVKRLHGVIQVNASQGWTRFSLYFPWNLEDWLP